MRAILLILFTLSFCATGIAQDTWEILEDKTIKVGRLGTPVFRYALAKGDELSVELKEKKGRLFKSVEVFAPNGEPVYQDMSVGAINGEIFPVAYTGYYYIRLKNRSLYRRFASLTLKRKPFKEEPVIVYDRIEEKKLRHQYIEGDTSVLYAESFEFFVNSTRNLTGSNRAYAEINLPADTLPYDTLFFDTLRKFVSNTHTLRRDTFSEVLTQNDTLSFDTLSVDTLSRDIYYWAYWISSEEKAWQAYAKLGSVIPATWILKNIAEPIEAYGLGLIPTLPEVPSGEKTSYFFVDSVNMVRYMNGNTYIPYPGLEGESAITGFRMKSSEELPFPNQKLYICVENPKPASRMRVEVKVAAFKAIRKVRRSEERVVTRSLAEGPKPVQPEN